MNDADGDPEFASDDIRNTENDIFNEHQLISVDNQDTYEDTNYLAYILIFPQSMILFCPVGFEKQL